MMTLYISDLWTYEKDTIVYGDSEFRNILGLDVRKRGEKKGSYVNEWDTIA